MSIIQWLEEIYEFITDKLELIWLAIKWLPTQVVLIAEWLAQKIYEILISCFWWGLDQCWNIFSPIMNYVISIFPNLNQDYSGVMRWAAFVNEWFPLQELFGMLGTLTFCYAAIIGFRWIRKIVPGLG